MKIISLHSWQVSPQEAREIQQNLASLVCRVDQAKDPCFIAGVDISAPDRQGLARGAVVVLGYPQMEVMEVKVARGRPGFPYVPGLLSFRESPLILEACARLVLTPQLVLVDGQGIAHPRRLGIASHLGLLLDTPAIGCAKSRLLGQHSPVGPDTAAWAELWDNGEVIGAVLRTRAGAEPLYVSIGHKVDLESARRWVLACCRGHRLPEPTRLAHLAAAGQLEEKAPYPQLAEQGRPL